MQVRDFEKRDAGRGLWEEGFRKGTAHYVRKECGKGTVGKGVCGRDCGKKDAGKGTMGKGCRRGRGCGGGEEAGERL